MITYNYSIFKLHRFLIYAIVVFILSSSGFVASGHNERNNDINIDNELSIDLTLSIKLEDVDAEHLRHEIDSPDQVSGLKNGFIEPEELESYENNYAKEALNLMRYISIDDTSPTVDTYFLEISSAGVDTYSQAPIYKNLSFTANWPDVNLKASKHKFVKSGSEQLTTIKISFGKDWEIKKYTGINNSALSKNKRIVSGDEWFGYLVIVNFERKDDDGLLPGFELATVIIAITVITFVYRYKKLLR